jgi:hypothetical protein
MKNIKYNTNWILTWNTLNVVNIQEAFFKEFTEDKKLRGLCLINE